MTQAYEADAQLMLPDSLVVSSYQRRAMPRAGTREDVAIAGVISMLLICIFALVNINALGWYLIPTFCCSLLFGKDMVALFRQKMDWFDPKAIVGCFGYVNTFVAPVVLVTFGNDDPQFSDMQLSWGLWVGLLGVLTFVASLLYMGGQRLGFRGYSKAANICRVPKSGAVVLLIVLAIAALACWVVYYFGAGGYEAIAENRDRGGGSIRGFGPLMVFGGAAPWLIFTAVTLARGAGKLSRRTAWSAYIILAILFVFQILLNGLNGSRSQIIGAAVAIIVQIHFFWSPIRRRHIAMGLIPLILFSYAFTFYKDFGSNFFELFRGRVSLSYLEGSSERAGVISEAMAPLSMSHIQSSILRTVVEHKGDYSLRFGKTYVAGAIGPIPGWLIGGTKLWQWSKLTAACEQAGTDYDPSRTYNPGAAYRIYGLAGEAMLNFGIVGPLIMFPIWGFCIGRMRRYLCAIPQGDMRLMIMPLFGFVLSTAIVHDFDNMLTTCVWSVFPALLITYLISRKVRQEAT
jgi:hypothetical protein